MPVDTRPAPLGPPTRPVPARLPGPCGSTGFGPEAEVEGRPWRGVRAARNEWGAHPCPRCAWHSGDALWRNVLQLVALRALCHAASFNQMIDSVPCNIWETEGPGAAVWEPGEAPGGRGRGRSQCGLRPARKDRHQTGVGAPRLEPSRTTGLQSDAPSARPHAHGDIVRTGRRRGDVGQPGRRGLRSPPELADQAPPTPGGRVHASAPPLPVVCCDHGNGCVCCYCLSTESEFVSRGEGGSKAHVRVMSQGGVSGHEITPREVRCL